MRILIIENDPVHIEAAKKQLAEHELTICASYEEAEEVFLKGGGRTPTQKPEFDVVLTDLFLPPCWEGTQFRRSVGQKVLNNCLNAAISVVKDASPDREDSAIEETIRKSGLFQVPYGIIFSLLCIKQGIPVAIVSDANHHSGPFMWAMDLLAGKFTLDTIKFFTSDRLMNSDEDGNWVKTWDKALEFLMKD